MGTAHQHDLEGAFEQIEETILPSISLMLDTLLDAATLGRPGIDAEIYAAEIRTIGLQLEALTREVESFTFPADDAGYRASVAGDSMICA